jgi:tRNA threonylcarbamoyl adenosine modification protein YeaZ
VKILALDTSTETAGVAVVESNRILGEDTWNTGMTHTTELIPRVEKLLKKLSIDISEINAVACAVGPGSFNGLRVGISTAKGLALVRELPSVGINTLTAIKESFDIKAENICVVLPAGRKEVAYSFMNSSDMQIADPETVCSQIDRPFWLTGEVEDHIRERFSELLGDRFIGVVEPERSRVGMIGLLGEKEIMAGNAVNASEIKAIYLKRPNITKPKKYHYLQG